MELERVTEDIHIYRNFLTKDECKRTIDMILEFGESEKDYWKGISFYESASARYPAENDPIIKKYGLPGDWFQILENRFKECAALVANQPVEKMSKISFHIQRWLPGAFASLHSDNTSSDGTYGAFTRSRYAGFMYLNDEFDGGLLRFEADHGKNIIEIKPEVGMFAIFHGGHKNMHEVTVVKHGTRYTIGSFWDDRSEEDYPQEVRDAWAKELADVRAQQKEQFIDWEKMKEDGLKMSPDGKVYRAEEVE